MPSSTAGSVAAPPASSDEKGRAISSTGGGFGEGNLAGAGNLAEGMGGSGGGVVGPGGERGLGGCVVGLGGCVVGLGGCVEGLGGGVEGLGGDEVESGWWELRATGASAVSALDDHRRRLMNRAQYKTPESAAAPSTLMRTMSHVATGECGGEDGGEGGGKDGGEGSDGEGGSGAGMSTAAIASTLPPWRAMPASHVTPCQSATLVISSCAAAASVVLAKIIW